MITLKKIAKAILATFLVILSLHAEEVASDDEIIENLEFLQLLEMMESDITFDEMEELDSVENVGILGERK